MFRAADWRGAQPSSTCSSCWWCREVLIPSQRGVFVSKASFSQAVFWRVHHRTLCGWRFIFGQLLSQRSGSACQVFIDVSFTCLFVILVLITILFKQSMSWGQLPLFGTVACRRRVSSVSLNMSFASALLFTSIGSPLGSISVTQVGWNISVFDFCF